MNDVCDSSVPFGSVSVLRLTLRWSVPYLGGFLLGLAPLAYLAAHEEVLLDVLLSMLLIAAVVWAIAFMFSKGAFVLEERHEHAMRARRGRRA